jgi:hypothetical protein
MARTAAMALVVLASVTLARVTLAQPAALLVAGNSEIAFIDADDDGIPDDSDDCVLGATVDNNGDIVVEGNQPAGPDKLKVCDGSCGGTSFISSDFLEVSFTSCDYSGAPFIPTTADFCDTVESCTPSSMSSRTGGVAGAPGPLRLVSGLITQPNYPPGTGFGNICRAGGPAAKITLGGMHVIKELEPFPNAQNPTHLCVPGFPVQLLSGQFVLRPACFPVGPDGMTIDFALSSDPTTPFALLDFGAAPGCLGGAAAPTTSELGLIALCATLLVGGTWMLARRRSFAGVLPLL